MSVDEERARLEREAEALVTMDDPEVEQRLIDVYERCGRVPGKEQTAVLNSNLCSVQQVKASATASDMWHADTGLLRMSYGLLRPVWHGASLLFVHSRVV